MRHASRSFLFRTWTVGLKGKSSAYLTAVAMLLFVMHIPLYSVFPLGDSYLLSPQQVSPFFVFNSNITSVKKVLYLKYDGFEDLTYSPRGTYLATSHYDSRVAYARDGGYNGGINLWHPETLRHLGVLAGQKFSVQDIDFTLDEKFLISASEDHTIRIWDVSKRSEVLNIEDVPRFYYAVKALPSGDAFLVGSSDKIDNLMSRILRDVFGSNYYLQLRDLKTGKVIRQFRGHADSVMHISLTQDGKHFITGSLDGSVRSWKLNSSRQVKLLFETGGPYIWGLSYSEDKNRVAFGFKDQVKIMDVDTGEITSSFTSPYHQVDFILGGNYLITYSPARFMIWDIHGNNHVLDVRRNEIGGFVGAHAISPDGNTLALGFTEDETRTQRIILLDLAQSGTGKS